MQEYLQEQAQVYRNLFEDLLKKDRLIFEEKCLQDVLLCRDQTYSFSLRDEDFNKLWRYRLTELLDKRNVYMQVCAQPDATAAEQLNIDSVIYLHLLCCRK